MTGPGSGPPRAGLDPRRRSAVPMMLRRWEARMVRSPPGRAFTVRSHGPPRGFGGSKQAGAPWRTPGFPGIRPMPAGRTPGPRRGVRAAQRGEAGVGRRRGNFPAMPAASPSTSPSVSLSIPQRPRPIRNRTGIGVVGGGRGRSTALVCPVRITGKGASLRLGRSLRRACAELVRDPGVGTGQPVIPVR